MDGGNHSVVSEFVFLGLTHSWEFQLLLLVFSSVLYVASMTGNILIVFSVTTDPHLHSPMYFLLASLSFIDLGACSVTSPKMIYDLFRKRKVISFGGCIAQIFFIHVIGGVEMVLLIAMAFDRYVAILAALLAGSMDGGNHSVVSEFVFLGLTHSWEFQLLLLVFSSVLYVASMTGNILIVFSVTTDPHLHSPMYFLLASLSFIDLGACSVTSPKMIYDLFRKRKVISFGGCIAQIFFIHVIGGVEMVLLIAMAFDRYVAI
ncbi:olfactory receptor 4F3/4F16/4F29-like, partial [Oryx dammah]|uniref:olfactory receptor 4F3/4F16/4F29-like n=1 Tax=Oryx dammah TaxID=59534 RepID=UPI001A9B2866